jgi:hypothetical protein
LHLGPSWRALAAATFSGLCFANLVVFSVPETYAITMLSTSSPWASDGAR